MSEAEETAEAVAEDVVATEEPVAEAVVEDAPVQDEPAAEVEAEPEVEAPVEAEAEDEVPEAVAAAHEEPVAEGLVAVETPAGGRQARILLCERGHRTAAIWSEPTVCHARPTRSGPECGRQLYPIGELPEQVQKALNPLKASKKASKG